MTYQLEPLSRNEIEHLKAAIILLRSQLMRELQVSSDGDDRIIRSLSFETTKRLEFLINCLLA